MELLSSDDPVYVVDLTGAALADCRAAFDESTGTDSLPEGMDPQQAPEKPIRAVAFLFEAGADPVLVPIRPTRDLAPLDAMARLVRAALATGTPVAELALHGDHALRSLYNGRRLPVLIYDPPACLPARLVALLRA